MTRQLTGPRRKRLGRTLTELSTQRREHPGTRPNQATDGLPRPNCGASTKKSSQAGRGRQLGGAVALDSPLLAAYASAPPIPLPRLAIAASLEELTCALLA